MRIKKNAQKSTNIEDRRGEKMITSSFQEVKPRIDPIGWIITKERARPALDKARRRIRHKYKLENRG